MWTGQDGWLLLIFGSNTVFPLHLCNGMQLVSKLATNSTKVTPHTTLWSIDPRWTPILNSLSHLSCSWLNMYFNISIFHHTPSLITHLSIYGSVYHWRRSTDQNVIKHLKLIITVMIHHVDWKHPLVLSWLVQHQCTRLPWGNGSKGSGVTDRLYPSLIYTQTPPTRRGTSDDIQLIPRASLKIHSLPYAWLRTDG